MTSEQFCYWLQGRAEMQPDTPPSAAEWQMIRDHLALVFTKVTPHYSTAPAIPQIAPWAPSTPVGPFRVECISSPSRAATTLC